jgi:hypothetical protein
MIQPNRLEIFDERPEIPSKEAGRSAAYVIDEMSPLSFGVVLWALRG